MRSATFAFWFTIALPLFVSGQEYHSSAQIVHDPAFFDGTRVGVHLTLDPDWHTYWENPGDVGAPPTLSVSSNLPIQQSELTYSLPKRISGDPFDYYGYEKEAIFFTTLSSEKLKDKKEVKLTVQFDWLVCKVTCIPCSKSFELTLPVEENRSPRNSEFDSFPYPNSLPDSTHKLRFEADQTVLQISSSQIDKNSSIDFFPAISMNPIFNRPRSIEVVENEVTLIYPPSRDQKQTVVGLLTVGEGKGFWIGKDIQSTTNSFGKSPQITLGLWLIFFFAFAGGFILNLMPCVLPVVSLKVFSALKLAQHEKTQFRRSNLFYGLGICVSTLLLGIFFIVLKNSGENIGWGFQLQSPTIVALLVVLFFVIGLNLIGYLEVSNIPIPGIHKLFSSHSVGSEFLQGFFMTVVATPCTAPFLAASVGFALTQTESVILAVFLFVGLGLASPYFLLGIAPQVGKLFPKPGTWMVQLKEILAFPMFLTSAWLVWVLASLTDNQGTMMILGCLVLLFMFFWARKKSSSHPSALEKLFLALILFLATLLAASSIKTKGAQSGMWEPFSIDQLSKYGQNQVTFVDFTADWCITCKANERLVLDTDDMRDFFRSHQVQLVKGDWTKRDSDITKVLQSYGQAGVPLYLVFKPGKEPMVLPQLLTPDIVKNAIVSPDTTVQPK